MQQVSLTSQQRERQPREEKSQKKEDPSACSIGEVTKHCAFQSFVVRGSGGKLAKAAGAEVSGEFVVQISPRGERAIGSVGSGGFE